MSAPRKSYSVHDIDGEHEGRKVSGWVLIEEELDALGEVEDTEMLAFYKTHEAALAALDRVERFGLLPEVCGECKAGKKDHDGSCRIPRAAIARARGDK